MTQAGPGTLYLVATPIGNLEDITLRALRVLREAAVIAAEDTRHTRKLLAHHDIPGHLVSLHEHNEVARIPEFIARLRGGDSIALVSDAGPPGLSDPGTALIAAAAAAGVPVVPVPGPSALLAALVVSGFPTAPVTFLGFLPVGSAERRRALEAARALPHTLVLYEAPHRLRKTLAALDEVWGDRRIAVARELTKIHEEVWRGRVREALEHFSLHPPRGEFTLVVEGASAVTRAPSETPPPDDVATRAEDTARAALRAALAEGQAPFQAVRRAARTSGLRRNEVYRLWLAIKQEATR
ncbi:MAG TPA: 16S rRNA (cytidine(1402)-2'-O)-methyltransferase [bacterium]|nr:16S rRNA (cytidine(1402)-2'-O)-methyltransferase [bacterium]